jgi:hypothetical protein
VRLVVAKTKKHRVLILGALALAAAGAPALAAFGDSRPTAVAQCLAAFGSLTNGTCLDAPSDNAGAGSPSCGIPAVGIGPSANGNGPGISTSPLFPGQTINVPMGP